MFIIAAGALVIKDNKVLVVKEKGGQRKGYYGVPGGRADRGELIANCAERELFEETGIRAKF
jgi:ADP-ribose pyrophosphatase YjhB (NUDIX family)